MFLTDRNDLDDQLFGEVFAPADILPEKPPRPTHERICARCYAVPQAGSCYHACSSHPSKVTTPTRS